MKLKCTERHDVTTTAADGFTEETKSKPTLSGGPYVAFQLLVRECGRCLLKIATLKKQQQSGRSNTVCSKADNILCRKNYLFLCYKFHSQKKWKC